MASTQIPKFSAVQIADTASAANAIVVRDTDKSINVGQTNMTYHNNSGGTVIGGLVAKTANATLDTTSTLVTADATSGAFTLTLPATSASSGVAYFITRVNTGSNAVFIKGSSTDTIVTSGTVATTTSLTAIGHQVVIWTDGTQWWCK